MPVPRSQPGLSPAPFHPIPRAPGLKDIAVQSPCSSVSPSAGLFVILPYFSDCFCSWVVRQRSVRHPAPPRNVLGSVSAQYRSLKGPFRSQLKHSEQLGFIWGWLFWYFVFQLPTRCFPYREGDKQDGENSRKKGLFLNNMPPELLHGNKGIRCCLFNLVIDHVCALCMFGFRTTFGSSTCRPEFQMQFQNHLVAFMCAITLCFFSEVSAKACVQADTSIYCEFSQLNYITFI